MQPLLHLLLMINYENIKTARNSKNLAVFIYLILFQMVVFCMFYMLFFMNNLQSQNESKLLQKIHNLNQENYKLEKEKTLLQLKINNYLQFSDSIQSTIHSNTRDKNKEISNLINLTNDELRKIAND